MMTQQASSRRSAIALVVAALASGAAAPASAQELRSPDHLALTIEPRGVYFGSWGASEGHHAGLEIAPGLRVPLGGSWAFVARLRATVPADLQTPDPEVDDSSCVSLGVMLCSADLDVVFPFGADIALRVDHVLAASPGLTIALGAELGAAGTGFLNSYERIPESGGVGGLLSSSLDFMLDGRFAVGAVLGARVEAGIGGPERLWLTAYLGLRFQIQLDR